MTLRFTLSVEMSVRLPHVSLPELEIRIEILPRGSVNLPLRSL
jgi:hypothetical protein